MIKINKKLLAILLAIAFLAGASGVVMLAGFDIGGVSLITSENKEAYEHYVTRYSKLETLIDYFSENYYQDLEEETLLEGAYSGVAASIGDEYTEYIPASDTEDYYNVITGRYYGIGMVFFENDDGQAEVDSCYVDSPSYNAGIKAGDIILEVDGTDISGMDTTVIRDMVRGDLGTTVTLTLSRDGSRYQALMERAEIFEKTISYEMLNDNTAYIYISSFAEKTAEEFKAALEDITEQGAEKFILDLRYNVGGLVDVTNDIADMIMDKGTLVVAQNEHGIKETYVTENGRTDLEYAVLVNGYTCSAAEILAAGIKDNDEGLIVGEQTFGKGIIQETVPWSDGSSIKLTILEYFSPSGEKIHGVGVTPDCIVELPFNATEDLQLNKALELLGVDPESIFNE